MDIRKPRQPGTASAIEEPAFLVVGIGASAGGLPALTTLLENMPPAPGMALVVALHLSRDYPSAADKLLQRVTDMRVVQVTERTPILPDHVYVIAPRRSLAIEDGHLIVDDLASRSGSPTTIDVLLRTLAETYRERAVGIVLSGMGSDGMAGLRDIMQHGGVTMAQLPGDAEETGMPRAAIDSGVVDYVLSAAQMPDRLRALREGQRETSRGVAADAVGEPVANAAAEPLAVPAADAATETLPDAQRGMPAVAPGDPPSDAPDDGLARTRGDAMPPQDGPPPALAQSAAERDTAGALDKILSMLRKRTGYDFRHYKHATVMRRLERRLQVRGARDLPAYCALLEQDGREPQILLQDLLIGVTGFFRDRAAFDSLERSILPALFEHKGPGEELRAWVAACSSGEEAYSLGMLLLDHADGLAAPPAVQVFATDIDARAIAIARAGRYPEGIAADVPPQRLKRHSLHGAQAAARPYPVRASRPAA